MNFIYNHTSQETAYIVENYPYGFRLRTQIRYWIETTKLGDRFVSQTLNPKTGKWNKEKKSTYAKVGVMFLNEDNHVRWTALESGNYLDVVLAWLTEVGAENFNDAQYKKAKETVAFCSAMENVTFECVNVTFQTIQQREELDKEQEEQNKALNRLVNYEYARLS